MQEVQKLGSEGHKIPEFSSFSTSPTSPCLDEARKKETGLNLKWVGNCGCTCLCPSPGS